MGELTEESIVGIIFPVLPEHARRLLEEGKTVFVKFCGKNTVPKKLGAGHKLFLYESGGGRRLVGEATIKETETGTCDQVWERFGGRLFLTRRELEEYVGPRRERKMLVMVLSEAKRFPAPLNLRKALTMAGQYMTRELLASLRESLTVS
jgi:hypothetical protein